MAALIEQGVNKGVNKPHSISSTPKVLWGMVPLWYGTGVWRFFIRRTLCGLRKFSATGKVQSAEVTKFVLGFKCDSSAPQTAGGECFYRLNK